MVPSGWRPPAARGPGNRRREVPGRCRPRNRIEPRPRPGSPIPVQEGGPALPLRLLDLQVLPDRQHPRFLQPPRGGLSPRQGARAWTSSRSPTTTRSTAASRCSTASRTSTDFFISEEVETWFPETRQRIHVNVFDIDEKQHDEISRRRRNIYDLHEYIREENIIASANHMFQNYRMRNSPRRYFEEMLRMFDVFEVKNGAMTSHHNRLVEDLMAVVREKRGAVSLVAGSDAHTLAPLARVYTVAEAASVREFLDEDPHRRLLRLGQRDGLPDAPLGRLPDGLPLLRQRARLEEPGVHGRREGAAPRAGRVRRAVLRGRRSARGHHAELPEADLRDEDGRPGAPGALGSGEDEPS